MGKVSRISLIAMSAAFAATAATEAAQISWIGPTSGGDWSNPANWQGGAVPASTDFGAFNTGTSFNAASSPTIAAVRGAAATLNSGTLTVTSFIDSSAFVIAPNGTLVANGADRSGNLVITDNGLLDLSTRDTGIGYLAGSGTVSAGATMHTLILDEGGNKTSTYSGIITGNVHLDIRGGGTNGSGRQIFTGQSNYTGGGYTEIGTFFDANTNVEVQLAGGDNRLPTGTWLFMGNNTAITKAKLILGDSNGVSNQQVTGIFSYANAGTAVSIVGGNSAGNSTLTVGDGQVWDFHGVLGGNGANENNLALTKQNSGTLDLWGINTYKGNTTINGGRIVLEDNAGLRFVIGANGVNNTVSGTGSLTLDGDFTLDLTGADTTIGNSWDLVHVATLNEVFDPTFTVNGFTHAGSLWTQSIDSSRFYQFSQSTGLLSVVAAPEPASLGVLMLGGFMLIRRRKTA